jgi:membrane protease YdiL (CAAX protease family)
MIGSVLELLVFSVPSLLYFRRLRGQGRTSSEARAVVGWRAGTPVTYGLSLLITLLLLPITYVALRAIPSAAATTSSGLHVTYGQASTVDGYLAIVLMAFAEEVLFRGFIAGLLFRRIGFAAGNILQAGIFFAPHLLLLLVSTALWPILPLQLVTGWLLGFLRWKSDSVGPSSVAHVAANLLVPAFLALR